MNEKKRKSFKAGKLKLLISKDFFNLLFSVVYTCLKADAESETKFGRDAKKIEEAIIFNSRKFADNEGEKIELWFYPSEAAILINLCILYISISEKPKKDFYNLLNSKNIIE